MGPTGRRCPYRISRSPLRAGRPPPWQGSPNSSSFKPARGKTSRKGTWRGLQGHSSRWPGRRVSWRRMQVLWKPRWWLIVLTSWSAWPLCKTTSPFEVLKQAPSTSRSFAISCRSQQKGKATLAAPLCLSGLRLLCKIIVFSFVAQGTMISWAFWRVSTGRWAKESFWITNKCPSPSTPSPRSWSSHTCELTTMHFARKRANLTSMKLVSYLNGCRGCMCFLSIFLCMLGWPSGRQLYSDKYQTALETSVLWTCHLEWMSKEINFNCHGCHFKHSCFILCTCTKLSRVFFLFK